MISKLVVVACLACSLAPVPPESFICTFEEPNAIKAFTDTHRADRFARIPDPERAENTTLRVEVAEGDFYGGSLRVFSRDLFEREPSRLYLSYRVRFGKDWRTEHTGKLPGFGGTYSRAGWGGKPSDGFNGWSARGWFGKTDEHGRVPVGSYVYKADMAEKGKKYGYGMPWGVALETERWYTIEQEIVLNSVTTSGDTTRGNNDGTLRAWVDGKSVFERTDMQFRDTTDLRVETAWLNIYYGGKTPAPHTMHLLIDDVVVALDRERGLRLHPRLGVSDAPLDAREHRVAPEQRERDP